ncbi:MAG: hypothetical protein PHI97_32915 [Desulfobulbus sp.]|nr:hypothetical protein [Desulfobulbus sp.]
MSTTLQAVENFIASWEATAEGNKAGFIRLKDRLAAKDGSVLEFHPRPGVTYSLRGTVPSKQRALYVMVDVIEDDPRWLSVCFFGDMITDPQELGSFVPGGLLGNDAICFDLEECSEEAIGYVEARIDEAYQSVAQ